MNIFKKLFGKKQPNKTNEEIPQSYNSGRSSQVTDNSNDLLNPLNPLSPFSPISPFSIWDNHSHDNSSSYDPPSHDTGSSWDSGFYDSGSDSSSTSNDW